MRLFSGLPIGTGMQASKPAKIGIMASIRIAPLADRMFGLIALPPCLPQ